MEVYEILFIAGFLLLILGMIPIFCGFIKTIVFYRRRYCISNYVFYS